MLVRRRRPPKSMIRLTPAVQGKVGKGLRYSLIRPFAREVI